MSPTRAPAQTPYPSLCPPGPGARPLRQGVCGLLADARHRRARLDGVHPFVEIAVRLAQSREFERLTVERRRVVGDLCGEFGVLGGDAAGDIGSLRETCRR